MQKNRPGYISRSSWPLRVGQSIRSRNSSRLPHVASVEVLDGSLAAQEDEGERGQGASVDTQNRQGRHLKTGHRE